MGLLYGAFQLTVDDILRSDEAHQLTSRNQSSLLSVLIDK